MKRFRLIFTLLLLLFLISYSSSKLFEVKKISNQVVIIPITGAISSDTSSSFLTGNQADSRKIVDFIEKADKNPNIKAIVLEINSPGGTVVASEEIARAVKNTRKPTIAWIRDVGASGAYWVASASDVIVADPLSVTGSIGVIGSYLEYSGLMEKYGVTYEQLISGKYKDTGSPYKPLTDEEKDLLQQKLDIIHQYFIEDVAKNRNLTIDKVENISTGIFYLGKEAKDLGLVDQLGGKEEVINILKEKLEVKDINFVEYKERKTIADLFSQLSTTSSYYIGKGIGSELIKEDKLQILA